MQRIALLGLGMAVKKHVLALRDLTDRAEVAACWSPTEVRREAFARDYGLPVTGDLDGIFADRSIGLVFILTPPWTHLDLAGNASPRASISCSRSQSKRRWPDPNSWSVYAHRPV